MPKNKILGRKEKSLILLSTIFAILLISSCVKKIQSQEPSNNKPSTEIIIEEKLETDSQIAKIFIKPSSNQIKKGDKIKIDIEIESVSDLAGIQLDLVYNPKLFSYSGIAEGTFLNKVSQTFFLKTIDTSLLGTIKNIAIARLSGGKSGSGLLASLYFNAIDSGTAEFSFGKVLLGNSQAASIEFDKKGAVVIIT